MHFAADKFQNEVPHGIINFWKDTNTGLYVNFTSFVHWTYHTAWIRSPVTRAFHICSTDKLLYEINIKRFVSWNDFPKSVVNSIINKTFQYTFYYCGLQWRKQNKQWSYHFQVRYYGNKVCSLIKSCICKSNQLAKKKSQLTSEFYMTSLRLISFVVPKIKHQH